MKILTGIKTFLQCFILLCPSHIYVHEVTSKVSWFFEAFCFPFQCTKIYPMALMCFSPLSPEGVTSFPHVLESSCFPPVPNPILESQLLHPFSLLPRIPILALEALFFVHSELNPSLLQLSCKEACEPISVFHVSRPSDVLRYCPSAISEYRELAFLLMTTNLIC